MEYRFLVIPVLSLRYLYRSSSTFVVQAALAAGDEVGVSIISDFPVLGYMNRSLTIVQLNN